MTSGGTDFDCANKDDEKYDNTVSDKKEDVLRKSDQYGEFFVSSFWKKTETIMYRIYCSDYDFDDRLYIKLYNSQSKIVCKTYQCLQKIQCWFSNLNV